MAETDLIRRSEVIEAIDNIEWYHQNASNEMVSGANPDEHQAWYKAEDVYKALESVPSAQPEIIRCKECLWRIGRDCTRFTDLPVYMDDYCGRAKRRGEQDETD